MREGDPIVPAQPAQDPPPPLSISGIRQRFFREGGAGIAVSLLLHALIVAALLFTWGKSQPVQPPNQPFVPVELVARSEGPAPQPAQQRAAGVKSPEPHIMRRASVFHHVPEGVAPSKTTPAPDDLERQLKALSKLRQPNTAPLLSGNGGAADVPGNGEDNFSGGNGDYNSRDIIRAQILRRWNLDLGRLGNRNFVVLIHVLLKRDGTVLEADIVDRQRYTSDAAYRWIALSARNAVLLSSPLALPSGISDDGLDMTLRLNPRDTLQ